METIQKVSFRELLYHQQVVDFNDSLKLATASQCCKHKISIIQSSDPE